MDKFGVDKLIKAAFGVPSWTAKCVKPSFADYTVYEPTGLYLPTHSTPDSGSTVGYANAPTTALPSVTPWSIGVMCMLGDLMKSGLYSKRLAELMYTASRVFEHNLTVQARRHRVEVQVRV